VSPPNLIETRVALARRGENPHVIARMPSGWVVIGDVQPLPGYCLRLADPIAKSINALERAARIQYSLDVIRVGDALLAATSAIRINYETWGNSEPALHTHIVPRYRNEPQDLRTQPACMSYDWSTARPFDPETDAGFMARMRRLLES
jgi:diadenosine tetraphosphate (Ap4A) HIT family hydrolase